MLASLFLDALQLVEAIAVVPTSALAFGRRILWPGEWLDALVSGVVCATAPLAVCVVVVASRPIARVELARRRIGRLQRAAGNNGGRAERPIGGLDV